MRGLQRLLLPLHQALLATAADAAAAAALHAAASGTAQPRGLPALAAAAAVGRPLKHPGHRPSLCCCASLVTAGWGELLRRRLLQLPLPLLLLLGGRLVGHLPPAQSVQDKEERKHEVREGGLASVAHTCNWAGCCVLQQLRIAFIDLGRSSSPFAGTAAVVVLLCLNLSCSCGFRLGGCCTLTLLAWSAALTA